MRLTDQSVRTLPKPEKGQRTFWDETLTGFGCRVSQGGARSFVVQFGANRQLVTIGKYHPDILPLAKARAEAKRILAENVIGKHRSKSVPFAEAKETFLKECGGKNKPRTVYDYTRLLKRHFSFGKTQLSDLSTSDIARKLDKIDAPAERRYATVVIKQFFSWAYRRGHLDASPADRLEVSELKTRARTLDAKELGKVLKAALAGADTFHAIVALLAITGQRRGEIAALQWSWINEKEKTITLPGDVTKNGREHVFPISKLVLSILSKLPRFKDNPYVFPATRNRRKEKPATVFAGWGKPKAKFDEKVSLAAWTLHDLRRTLRTMWAELGISREVAERYVNHVSGVHSGIVAVYDRHSYLPEMREAVKIWERHVAALLKAA